MIDDAGKQGPELREIGGKWMERIRTAQRRDEDWLKDARAAERTYSMNEKGDAGKVPDFNILYSNVETIVPSIYNSTPVPDIRPKWSREMPDEMQGMEAQDPVKVVSDILERAVAIQIDDNSLDTEIEGSAQDAFLAGRGIVRVRMDSDVEEFTQVEVMQDPVTFEYTEEEVTYQQVSNERVLYETVPWRDYLEGPASRFEDLPWVAFKHTITQEMLADYDEELMSSQAIDNDPSDNTGDMTVWEIWCKDSRTVKFVRENDGVVMKMEDDPLGLKGFFPIHRPVQPVCLTGRRTPINPYKVYRKQAEELDKITRRINAIVDGLRVRGGIAGDAENIQAVADAGDNELVPIRNVEGLAQTGGLDKAIIWWPVDMAIQVLRELMVSREQTKQLIYEITGISDIVRGSSNSGETATAQQIKTQWGSLRINKMQRLIERQVRDLFVITSELIAKNFSPERLTEITGIQATEEVMAVMEGGVEQYIIDVESDSTVRADLTRMKGEMGEFLNGTASFFSTMAPVVAQAPQMAGAVVDLYSAFARQFNLGKQAEDALEQMGNIAKQSSQNTEPSPEQMAGMKKAQLEEQKLQADVALKTAELQHKREMGALDVQIKEAELALREAELRLQEAGMIIEAEHADEEIELEREQRRAVKIGDE